MRWLLTSPTDGAEIARCLLVAIVLTPVAYAGACVLLSLGV